MFSSQQMDRDNKTPIQHLNSSHADIIPGHYVTTLDETTVRFCWASNRRRRTKRTRNTVKGKWWISM